MKSDTVKPESEDMTTQRHDDEDKAISDSSPIKLGVVLGMGSIVVVLISAAWFLSSSLSKIETKLDTITVQLSATAGSTQILERRASEHERDDQMKWTAIDTRVSIIEKTGSDKTRDLERDLNNLRNDFKVHTSIMGGK